MSPSSFPRPALNEPRLKVYAISELIAQNGNAVTDLIQLLNSNDNEMRFWVIYILGSIGSEAMDAAPVIEEVLISEEDSLRGVALWAIHRITGRSSGHTGGSDDGIDVSYSAVQHVVDYVKKRDRDNLFPQDISLIGSAIEWIDSLRTEFAGSSQMDRLLFLSGEAKILLGHLLLRFKDKSDLADYYAEKFKNDYVFFLGVAYKGNDFQEIVEKYPESTLADEALLIIAQEKLNVGECEGDIDCNLHSIIGAYLPYIQKYPSGQEVGNVISLVNEILDELSLIPSEYGLREIGDLETINKLLNDYYDALIKVSKSEIRDQSLFYLARAFISAAQYEKAEKMYIDLEKAHENYRNARSKAAHMMFLHKEGEIDQTEQFYNELNKYTEGLSSSEESVRLQTIETIASNKDYEVSLLFSIMFKVAHVSINDRSDVVRRKAMKILAEFAPQTSFLRSALSYCFSHEPNLELRYSCTEICDDLEYLKNTKHYYYYRDKILEIKSEYTGRPQSDFEQQKSYEEKAREEWEVIQGMSKNVLDYLEANKDKIPEENRKKLREMAQRQLDTPFREGNRAGNDMVEPRKSVYVPIIIFAAAVLLLLCAMLLLLIKQIKKKRGAHRT